MNATIYQAKYEESYTGIPLFSEPYKIKTVGLFLYGSSCYEPYGLFLKSHGANYLLIFDNDKKLMTLMSMNLENYLEYMHKDSEILLFDDILFNPRNDGGIVKNDILSYDGCGRYTISDERLKDYREGKVLSKKEFIPEFFDTEQVKILATGKRPRGYDTGLEKLLDEIIKDDIYKNINYTKFEKNLDEIIKENKEYKIHINDYKEDDPYNR